MRDFNQEYSYRPYTGGAGPTRAQAANLIGLLFIVLRQLGLDANVENDAEEDTAFVVLDSRRVTYDRWGYVNQDGHPDIELDQVDLNTAVAYFVEGK